MARILVVDDKADLRSLLEDVLEAAGHEVILAADGLEALALVRTHQPDLVITDMFMPGISGLTLVRGLTNEADVKIIAMSGGGHMGGMYRAEFLAAARDLGAACTLQKPFAVNELLAVVNEVLGGRLARPGEAPTPVL